MKCIYFLPIVILLICSCSSFSATDEINKFIPGVYTRFSQHEFGTEYDTLSITLQNKSANEYAIVRKWKYERVLDGSSIEPEYKQITTSGIYDHKHKLLQETVTGDVFSFNIKEKLLFNGPTKYRKL